MTTRIIYLPGLNGLRAIAAISVVLSHTIHALAQFNLNPYLLGTNNDGGTQGLLLAGFGVSIFFALSGFLITYLLLLEKEKASIDIPKFYLRRILRIWPLYYLYLLLAVITVLYYDLYFNRSSLLLYVFYSANIPFILGITLPFLAHYWSLGVEEQFYLFWPWIVKFSKSKLLWVIAFLIVFLVSAKLILHFYYSGSLADSFLLVSRFHCMMIGAFGAVLYYSKNALFLKFADTKLTQIGCWIILVLVGLNKFHIASVIDNELISMVTVLLIVGQINCTNRIVNLENNFFDFLGKISYGIYVVHPLVIFFLAKLLMPLVLPDFIKYFLVFFSTVGGTVFIAFLSYNYYEKYFLTFKQKFSIVPSSGTRKAKN